MKNNFDNFTNTITQPDVFLCHRNYDVICPLTPITDLKIYEAANSYDEITFSFNKVNNGVEFEYWDKLKSLKVVKVKNGDDEEKYFEIAVDVSDEESTVKNITGISIEGELAQISIGTLSINGETDRNKDSNWENNTYISTVVYKASDTNHSLLHRILSYAPHWKIGHVDSHVTDPNTNQLVETSSVVRTFEFSNTNVYDALQEVAKELDVVFTFDSKTRSVNMYDLNTVGEDTTVFVNKENLANSFTCSSNKDSVKNCFKVTGGDDLINSYVRSVNPNGSEYIYYISKDQREDMSDELVAKLDAYDNLYESKKTEYKNVCAEMFAAIDDMQKYTNTLAPQRTDATTTALDEYNKLKNIASVYVQSKKNLLQKGVEKAILTLAQITVDYRYTITIQDEDTYDEVNSIWTGKFKVVNESNDEDVVVGTDDVTISILEDEKTSLQNQIDKLIGDGDFEDAAVDELKEKYIDKDPKDYDYCQERLQEMWKVYAECANVLLEKGYAVKKDDNKFYSLYSEYHQKEQILSTAYLNMTNYIESLEKIKEEKAKQVNAYHDELDFVKFLGDKLYKEFCCYRREDVYENSNYISDGLSDKEAIEKAKTLIEVATKELYKASLFQYTYTANLNNLFNNSVFKPFWEHFALFNWIRVEVDERVISLRLIGITYDYANPDKIEVEFSEQVRNANGITDLESILNQAKSMATSYSSTAKQASQGAESYSDFKTLKEEGLNSALMNIKNSNNEEVTVDGRGINCRSKDINDDYDQCQLRITGKNIVMTDDDWNSARLAIGRGLFNGQEKYGVWCDILVGNIVASETLMISNGSKTFIVDKDGIIVNNMKLDMYSADKKHRLLIDPNLKSMFNIYNEDKQVFFIDANGNVTMKGNLYINNGSTYLKADMDDENIIEIGCGEIEDTGNDGEIGKDDTEYVTQEWYRSSDALNMLNYAWDNKDDYNFYFRDENIIKKNGNIYMIHGRTIRVFNKAEKSWNVVYDFSNVDSGLYETDNYGTCFVKEDRNDNCLYIYKHRYYSDIKGSLYAYNLNNNQLYQLWDYDGNEVYHYYYVTTPIIKDNTLYMFSYNSGTEYNLKVKNLPYSEDGVYSTKCTSKYEGNPTYGYTFSNFVFYNGNLYCMRLDLKSYTASLCKVVDLDGKNVKILKSNICNISTDNDSHGDFSCFIHKNKLYIIPFVKTKAKNYYVYDFSNNELTTKTDLPPLLIGDYRNGKNGSYREYNSCLAFSDGEDIHLYNNMSVYSYNNNSSNGLCHYIYNEANQFPKSNNFKEIYSGKNFINTLQNNYVVVGDKIYSSKSSYNFVTSVKEGDGEYILCLDTSKENADWEIIYTMKNNYSRIVSWIQSNAKDKVYFVMHVSYGVKSLCYYDIVQKKIMFLNKNGEYVEDDDETDSSFSDVILTYGFIDDENQIAYRTNSSSLTITKYHMSDGLQTGTILCKLNHSVVSNPIYKNNSVYYIASVNSDTYSLYKTDFNGSITLLAKLMADNDYNEDFGFSIFLYNNKIQIFHSYHGVLSKDRYVYNLLTDKMDKYSDVFQDFGLYVINNLDGNLSKKTIFLPMIPTENNGVHIFVGYPFFSNTYENGGYKHYVYTEGTTEPDNPDLPNIPNPTDKIFYITNKGDAYLYGNIYAKDGIFRGDIYARSLTLGSDVSIDTSKITGLDDKLKDIENDFSGVNNDLKNVIYKGDITTTTEKLDNGIIKTTNRVPSGTDADGNVIYKDSVTYTSADGNYVMTDVGLGDKEKENGHYVVISKDGLLEAINATIAGTIYAGAGKIAGWDITDLCLSSEMYDDFENYSGIKLTSSGNIYTRGKYFNSEGYWAKLYSGKWIFSFGDGSIFDTSKGYCDISAAGIYIASRQTIETPESRYLFNVDVLNDVVKIESSSNNPALSINNNSDGTCLEVRNNSSTYENKALSIGVTVVNTDDNGNNSTGMGYITVFGEGIAGSAGRIIMRPDQNIKSTDTVNPANYTNSACGTYYYPWGTMSCIQLYVDKTSTTSDAKLKTPIKLIDGDIALKFINGLIPREYYLNNSENKRHHMGFYAQEVSQLAKNLNLGDMAIYEAIVSKDGDETEYYYDPNVDDEHLHWSLNYNEFIAPLVGSVQELVKRDKENKERINKLENTVETLLEEVKSLKEQISNQ
jgi:hypothetical protein